MPPTVQPTKVTKIKNVNLTTLTSVTFGGPTCFPNQISPPDPTNLLAGGSTLRRSGMPCSKDRQQVEPVSLPFSVIGELAKAVCC